MTIPLCAASRWADALTRTASRIETLPRRPVAGRLVKATGMVLEAVGCSQAIGGVCTIETPGQSVEAEVVGFAGDTLYLMPFEPIGALLPGSRVRPHTGRDGQLLARQVPLGASLLGRVVDAAGEPLDAGGPLHGTHNGTLDFPAPRPLDRAPIDTQISVGVRAIDGLLAIGRGQRMGLFAGSGVGKSVLLGMMARFTSADVVVVGLIGERGREVQDFIDNILGVEGRKRAVVVAAPADTSPLRRLHGAKYATRIAEDFRQAGLNVLLIMDSLTRYAMAQREIALAIGEPPATKGYPPSVFALLPRLVERAGNGLRGSGSITAFYTVLTEGDDQQDPIADSARAILDGHIVLSRSLAESGHYPAVDIEASISRAMPSITPAAQQQRANQLKQLLSRYQRNRDLISVGAYAPGHDPLLDRAVQRYPQIETFLRQHTEERVALADTLAALDALG